MSVRMYLQNYSSLSFGRYPKSWWLQCPFLHKVVLATPTKNGFPPTRPFSQLRLHQGLSEQMRLVWADTVLISSCPPPPKAWTGIVALTIIDSLSQNIGVLQVVASDEDACDEIDFRGLPN